MEIYLIGLFYCIKLQENTGGKKDSDGTYFYMPQKSIIKKKNFEANTENISNILPFHGQAFSVSVIIPTYNEAGNVRSLIARLETVLMGGGVVEYEIIFIDDNSTDSTYEHLLILCKNRPYIKIFRKVGKKGKSYSILEGLLHAQYEVIVMIDADLQYPPEAIPQMLAQLSICDIVVANRNIRHTSRARTILSSSFNKIFGRFVLNLNTDIQSGLKVFRRAVFHNLHLSPSKWGFDYEFLYKAKRMGWRIGEVPIEFAERTHGESSVHTLRTGIELAWGSIILRARYLLRTILKFLDYPHHSESQPLNFKSDQDFLFLSAIHSAKKHFYSETVSLVIFLLILSGGLAYGVQVLFGISIFVLVSGLTAIFYLSFLFFKIRVIYHTVTDSPAIDFSDKEIADLRDEELPMYTILIPLYREEGIIPQIISAMTAIDYPPNKLDVIITLEEYDYPTINAIAAANPPAYFKTCILPNVHPKTKPKALNVAFLDVKGEFLVIYDAEIIPDQNQMKKAVLAFRKYPQIGALQTYLDHYNPRQSLITKLFNAEFSFHYDFFLPGLQKLGFPIPLSGHSTHFRTEILRKVGAWDPYNMTEDCDLGIRLCRYGVQIGMLKSASQEEATVSFKSWILQRTRWMKGFIQTSIVHLRHPLRFKNEVGGWKNFVGFFFIVPGTIIVNLINFIFWLILVVWIVAKPPIIQSLFPAPILYISVFSFVVGNFFFMYMNLLASYRRGRYDLVKYNLLSFVYWIMLAVATMRAAIEFFTKPYHWAKTEHGTHLAKGRHFAFGFPQKITSFIRRGNKTL